MPSMRTHFSIFHLKKLYMCFRQSATYHQFRTIEVQKLRTAYILNAIPDVKCSSRIIHSWFLRFHTKAKKKKKKKARRRIAFDAISCWVFGTLNNVKCQVLVMLLEWFIVHIAFAHWLNHHTFGKCMPNFLIVSISKSELY